MAIKLWQSYYSLSKPQRQMGNKTRNWQKYESNKCHSMPSWFGISVPFLFTQTLLVLYSSFPNPNSAPSLLLFPLLLHSEQLLSQKQVMVQLIRRIFLLSLVCSHTHTHTHMYIYIYILMLLFVHLFSLLWFQFFRPSS